MYRNENPSAKPAWHMIQLILLAFWSIWFCLACASNISDWVYAANLSPYYWTFHSGNYALVQQTVNIYHGPGFVAFGLFTLDILIQAAISILFILASMKAWQNGLSAKFLIWPLMLNIFLWSAFLVMEEFFLAYSIETVHQRLLILAILTALCFRKELV